MNYSKLLLTFALMLSFGASAQNSEERKVPNITPSNNLENPASYADRDHYKIHKTKGSLVYGNDYIFEGISASDVSQQLIDEVDPYKYVNQLQEHHKVFVDLPEHGLVMILFPVQGIKVSELNENE
ncbi:hypothetical protein N9355_04845 [Crocinitomicaceae bacterium]|nr:hypothetical protein [Crocinitomicaceae bacterium]